MPAIGARTTAGSTASPPSFSGGRAVVVGSSVLVTPPSVGGGLHHPYGVTSHPLRRGKVSGMHQGDGTAVIRPRVAVALGGGGARGYAHIGILQVLRERGYGVVSIAGSSMGAVTGGLFAAGGLDAYADWVRGLTHRDVLRLYDPSPRAPGAIRAEKIFARVAVTLGDARIEALPIPFTAVATDLETGEERWLQEGPVDAAIRASAALPGFMTPVVL